MEHRQAQREPLEILIRIRTGEGVTFTGRIKDISALGAGVVMLDGMPERNSIIEIQSGVTDKHRAADLRAKGYVVRVTEQELGLLWVNEETPAPIFKRQSVNIFPIAKQIINA